MTPGDESLALQIARLQGTVETGFATVRGEVGLVARATMETKEDLVRLEHRTDALESRRFPLPVIGSLTALGALGMSAFTLVRGG